MVDKIVEETLHRIETSVNVLLDRNPSPQVVSPSLPVMPSPTVSPSTAPVPKVCTRQVTFSETLAVLQGIKMEEPSPLTGEIIEVTMAFPDGCNGLVELQFGHGGVCVMPSKKTEFIALNNSTPTFRNLREQVSKGEKLWAILRNGDAVNLHKPSIIVVIVGVE